MPVEDINAVQMGVEFTNLFNSTETTSDFWLTNTEVLAWVALIVFFILILLGAVMFTLFLIRRFIKNH